MIETESAPMLSSDQKIAEFIAYEEGRELLVKYLPELMNSPWLSQVMGFTLDRASFTLPHSLKADTDIIKSIENDLRNLSRN